MKNIRSFRPAALTLALLLALCQPVLAQTVSVTRGPYLQTGGKVWGQVLKYHFLSCSCRTILLIVG